MAKKVGIPRALLFYKYNVLWENFFKELGCELIISPKTNKEIMDTGIGIAVDECCLPVKIFLGHVSYLKDRVDYIFIPRVISIFKKEFLCVKFWALYDIVNNNFDGIKIIDYSIDLNRNKSEKIAFLKMGLNFTKNPIKIKQAYELSKKKQEEHRRELIKKQEVLLKDKSRNKIKILIVSHPYTTYDGFLGEPIIKFLKNQDIDIIYSDIVDEEKAYKKAKNLSKDIYWTFNKEFLGAIELYKKHVDGIIFLMSFPCGPDSLVVDLCQHKIKDKPITVITLDELQAEAGLKTRLESFADILRMKKNENKKN